MESLQAYIDGLFDRQLLHNIAIRVGCKDKVLYDFYKSDTQEIHDRTLFDMASVTKILSVTALSLMAAEAGKLSFWDKVSRYFPIPRHFEDLTVFHLLTHTMGVGHRPLNFPQNNYDNIAHYILSLEGDPVGQDVEYSCPAFILIGKILERVYGKGLDVLFRELVAEPLGMTSSCFCPDRNSGNFVNSNLEPEKKGIVNDYNCQYLGGIAGNAGIFSCIADLTKYAHMLLSDGKPLFSKATLDNASQNHTLGMSEARGLGFLYVDDRYPQTGKLFPVGSIGHCGHTGQSLFVNRTSGLYVIILSDATISTVKKYGHEDYSQVMQMREDIHNLIKEGLQS